MTTIEQERSEEQISKYIGEVEFEEDFSQYHNQMIGFEAEITKVDKPQVTIRDTIFECRSCMRIHEMKHPPYEKEIREPAVCQECGGRSFKLIPEESTYSRTQRIIVGKNNTKKKLELLLTGDMVFYDCHHLHDMRYIRGIPRIIRNKDCFGMIIECIYFIKSQHNSSNVSAEYEDNTSRNEEGYTDWRNNVIERDEVCQICGGSKHLEAHHLFSYKQYPDRRTELGNGITLCKWCHQKFHSYKGKNVTPADLICHIFERKCNI